jgi:hypothetical protein
LLHRPSWCGHCASIDRPAAPGLGGYGGPARHSAVALSASAALDCWYGAGAALPVLMLPRTVTSMSWTTPSRPPAEPDGGVVVQNDCLLAILVPSGRRGAVARRPRPHRAPGTGSTLPTRGVLEPRRSFVRSRSLGAPCRCPTARPPEPEVGEAVFNEGAAPVACATPGWRGREVASLDRLATFPHRPLAAIARLRSGGYAGHVS